MDSSTAIAANFNGQHNIFHLAFNFWQKQLKIEEFMQALRSIKTECSSDFPVHFISSSVALILHALFVQEKAIFPRQLSVREKSTEKYSFQCLRFLLHNS